MNAWQWWSWSLLIILQLTQADEIEVNGEAVKDDGPKPNESTTTYQERQRRDVEWTDGVAPYPKDEAIFPKRDPILSRWGGQRLSDLLYFKRRPAFSSWGGKRGPAFSSWGGKRSMPEDNLDRTQHELPNTTDSNHDIKQLTLTEKEPDPNAKQRIYEIIQNAVLKGTPDKNKLLHTPRANIDAMNSLQTQNVSNNGNSFPANKMYPPLWNEPTVTEYTNVDDSESDNSEDYGNDVFDSDDGVREDITSENGNLGPEEAVDKRAAPSFNSWGGKRAAILGWGSKWIPEFNHWQGKKATAFNSWGGKRAPAFNSWGGKRAPAFNSWGGKRATAFNSWGGKRATAFNSWGGKRAPAFNSWGGKRATAFNSWGGKRAPAFNSWGGKRATAFNSWGGKRSPAFNSWGGKRATAFNSWGGKRSPAFNSWGGKRSPAFNSWGGKRATAFNSWGGKRATAFNSWGGKRATAFNSWGGKRDMTFNGWQDKHEDKNEDWNDKLQPTENSHREKRSADHENSNENPSASFNPWEQENDYRNYDGKRATAFNSWGGKRSTAFNSWGGKRAPAFNSWGGKRAPAFNSWGGKRAPAFNSWGGKRAPAFNSWGGKRAPAFNSWGGKRAPAFNSWGGKRMPNTLEDAATPEFNRWEDAKEQAYYDWGNKHNYDEGLDEKRATQFNKGSGKRLPAFHSWGGKRFKSLTTLTPNENTIHFLGSGTDQNHPFDSSGYDDSDLIEVEDEAGDNNPNEDVTSPNNYSDGTVDRLVKRSFRFGKQEAGGKRDPAFFSWGGKRSETDERADYDDDTTSGENIKLVTLDDMDSEDDDNDDEDYENLKVSKRNLDLKYNPEYMFQYFKPNYADKRRPIFSSWGGKRNALSSVVTLNEEKTHGVRKKRYVGGEAGKAIALIVSDNDVTGNGIRSTAVNEIYSVVPSGMTVCCIKRAQYGDRNLFMQMLLRTKSFRDLSWPTIRPIRRGADFYPWGGKRSSL